MQQINLYLPEFRPNREPLRTIHMLWAALALMVVLILLSGYSSHRNSLLREQVAAEQAGVQAAQAQLQQLAVQQPPNQRAQLDADIQRLQAERDRRLTILLVIANQDLGNYTGFSAHLQALARQSLETLALTRFSLQNGARYIEFSGQARTANQVPLYLQRLRSEPSFMQTGFGTINVKRGATAGAPLSFSVTRAESDTSSAIDDYMGGQR
jgi:hypothetical protein